MDIPGLLCHAIRLRMATHLLSQRGQTHLHSAADRYYVVQSRNAKTAQKSCLRAPNKRRATEDTGPAGTASTSAAHTNDPKCTKSAGHSTTPTTACFTFQISSAN